MKLVRIVAERRALGDIVALLKETGANGYTVTPAIGEGAHGPRLGDADDNSNIVVDCVTSDGRADAILRRVHDELFATHAVIAYVVEARVIRREKFL
ncbi:MAG: hypothetical protein MUE41_06325 [Gemmatimonadaceae bacterium]|nr:hypothetical protein [Gemmatimonadaceae bacterium]